MIFDNYRKPTCLEETSDGLCVVPASEYMEGMSMSFWIGMYYIFEGWIPLLVYYTYKKNAFESGASVSNGWYKAAWYTMVYGQWLVFLLPAFMWPFSYILNPTIVVFYALVSQWVAGFMAFILYFAVTVMYIIAGVTLNTELVWVEMAFYIVLQISAFFFTLNKLPLAY